MSPRTRSLLPRLVWGGVAAAILAAVGWQATIRYTSIAPHHHLMARYEIWTLVAQVDEVLGLGLGDHIFCAAFRRLQGDEVMAGKALMEIGDDQAELLETVRAVVPERMSMRIAHRCEHRGREFVHFALVDGDDLISVLATARRDGEAIEGEMQVDRAGPYEAAAFERGEDWMFVVSNLDADQNAGIARDLRQALDSRG